jgi:hypothetical protein
LTLDALEKFSTYIEKRTSYRITYENGEYIENFRTEINTLAASTSKIISKKNWQTYENGILVFILMQYSNLMKMFFAKD